MSPSSTSSLKRGATDDDGTLSPPPLKRKQQSTTTQKTVANFFKPASQKEPEKVTWRIVDNSLLVGKYNAFSTNEQAISGDGKRKIAAFDFDSTLITSKSGLKFSRDASDWKWWHAAVPSTLKRLHSEGYLLAIVSNQKGISLKSGPKSAKSEMKRLSDFKQKAVAVFNQLDMPMSVYAATENDKYRKPRIGMWRELLDDHGLGTSEAVDLENCIFVGDAGGRSGSTSGGVKGDFACSDRDLAANIGIAFRTPEEFFLNEDAKPFTRDFDPTGYVTTVIGQSTDASPILFSKTNKLDIVMFCGSPGSGKSTFYWKHLKPLGYERVNQDLLKTRDRCLKVAGECLEEGKAVAIDNTNANREARLHWINLAKKFKVPIRCVYFTASEKLCRHNDAVRALNINETMNPEKRTILPSVAFSGFKGRFEEPKVEEGFEDIVKIDFTFEGSDEEKAVWSKYWI